MNTISEISPSFAMKMNSNGYASNDIWGDNIDDSNPSYSPFLSCPMGHSFGGKSNKDQCYNFDFRNGAPISGKEYFSTPTLTHG